MFALPSIAFADANKYDEIIADASATYRVPKTIIKAVIATESSFRNNAQGTGTSAIGLMQITRAAAADAGFDHSTLFDARNNIHAGAAYLGLMLQWARGNYPKALAAYYAGMGTLSDEKITQLDLDGYAYAAKVLAYALSFSVNEGFSAGV